MATSDNAAPTSSNKESINVSDAVNHLVQGKRHMLVQDYASAVSSLQTATEIFASNYGEMADECGDAYYNYGKSLLELARLETGVLGNALDGVPEEEEEKESSDSSEGQVEDPEKLSVEEKEKIAQDVCDAIDENSRDLDAKVAEWKEREMKKTNGTNDEKDVKPEEVKVNGEAKTNGHCEASADVDCSKTNGHSDKDVNGVKVESETNGEVSAANDEKGEDDDEEDGDDENEDCENKEEEIDKSPAEAKDNEEPDEEEKEDKEEEVTNLQLAWEVLELAKVIFERQAKDDKKMKLKVADTYLNLGEIAIESGNYQQANEDLNQCLKIQKEELVSDDRLIAETYYQLGLAFSFGSEFDDGIEHFEHALNVIKTRITNLEKSSKDEKDIEKQEEIFKEIKDLNGIIPEINSKVDDTKDMKKSARKAQEDAIKDLLAKQKVMGDDGASTSQSETTSAFGSTSQKNASPQKICASPTKPVSNIGHLVRKKRKGDEISSLTTTKKVCSTEGGDEVKNGKEQEFSDSRAA